MSFDAPSSGKGQAQLSSPSLQSRLADFSRWTERGVYTIILKGHILFSPKIKCRVEVDQLYANGSQAVGIVSYPDKRKYFKCNYSN